MIISNKRWIPELLTKFSVLSLDCNTRGESMWTIQYKNSVPFIVSDKGAGTIESDVKLVGKEVESQISLYVEEILPITKKEKSFRYNDATIFVTAIYENIIIQKLQIKHIQVIS